MLAIELLLVDHVLVAPPGPDDKVISLPTQTLAGLGVIAVRVGAGFTWTVTEAVTLQPLAEATKSNRSSSCPVVRLINAPTSEPGVTVPPGPAGSMPARFALLIPLCQLYETPAVPPKVMVNCEPEHVVIAAGVALPLIKKVGVVLTVTVTAVLELSQPPTVCVT
jgi:hypothetical protein